MRKLIEERQKRVTEFVKFYALLINDDVKDNNVKIIKKRKEKKITS